MKMPHRFLSSRTSTLAPFILLCLSASIGCGPEDPAANNDDQCLIACEAPEPTCDGDTVVQGTTDVAPGTCTCEPGEDIRTDCAQTGKTCMAGACVDTSVEDKCDGVVCDSPPAKGCDGDSVVTYAATGTCNADTGMCAYEETSSLCASATGDPVTCMAGECVSAPTCEDDSCNNPPATACDGNTVQAYAAAGSCGADNMCVYAVTETNCEDDSKICQAGVCVEDNGGTVRAPVAGDIVITEIMYDPKGLDAAPVSDNDGEWVEFYNKTDDTLNLEGLVFQDAVESNAFVLPAVTIAPKSYFVLAKNDDVATNGNVVAGVKYTKIGFNNSGDGDIVLLKTDAGVEIAKVEYNFNAGWTDVVGTSLQLSGDADLDSGTGLTDSSSWCPATTAWDGADLGTPGAANTNCPNTANATLFTIPQLQNESDAAHPAQNTPAKIEGATVSAVSANAIWVQSASAAHSGLKINVATATLNLVPGTSVVDVQGVYREDSEKAVIDAVAADVTLSNTPPIALTPMPLTKAVLADTDLLEAHESLLVRIEAPAVTNANPDAPSMFNEFLLNGSIRVDDALFAQATPSANCDTFEFVQGILDFSFTAYKIQPRDAADLGARTSTSLIAGDKTVVFSGALAAGLFNPSTVCMNEGSTVSFSNASAASISVVSRDVDANGDVDANPAFDLTIAAAAEGEFTPAAAGVYPYRERTDAGATGIVVVIPTAP